VLLLRGDDSPKQHMVHDRAEVVPYGCPCGLVEFEPDSISARGSVSPTRVNGFVYFAGVEGVLHNVLVVSRTVDSDDFCQGAYAFGVDFSIVVFGTEECKCQCSSRRSLDEAVVAYNPHCSGGASFLYMYELE